jgi:hypothetical protein
MPWPFATGGPETVVGHSRGKADSRGRIYDGGAVVGRVQCLSFCFSLIFRSVTASTPTNRDKQLISIMLSTKLTLEFGLRIVHMPVRRESSCDCNLAAPCGRADNMPDRTPISFKKALALFKAECIEVAPKAGELDVADQEHLARWADDPRAEAVWQKVQSLAWGPVGAFEPLDGFIPAVLGARRGAETAKTNSQIIQRHRQRCARHQRRAKQLEALSEVWKDIARGDDPRSKLALERTKMYKDEAEVWRRLSKKSPLPRPVFVSRVDRRGSRKQRMFMQLIGKFLAILCRRPLDSEVCVLNDIAFDTAKATTVFQARSARRPTTQRERSSTAKKPVRNVAVQTPPIKQGK